jgi:protein-S-isoprenylcysteine O-methyltransferase Ste14
MDPIVLPRGRPANAWRRPVPGRSTIVHPRLYDGLVQVLVWTTVVGWLAAEVILRGRHHGRTEPTVTREWRSLGVIWLAAAAGGVVAGVLAANLHALDLPLRRPAWLVLVLVIAWCGIGLRLWSIATLGRYFQPIVHIQQGHQVVKAGPYRVLRHPAYTGILLAVLGLSLLPRP